MKPWCLLIGLFVALSTSAAETVATGYGSNESAALAHAKLEALAHVAGTFISATTDVQEELAKEEILEYSGGFIRGYEVLNISHAGGFFAVTIHAEVDAAKINDVAHSTGRTISASSIAAAQNAQFSQRQLHDALHGLVQRGSPFATRVTSITYDIHGRAITLQVALETTWSPKWYDDLLGLAKAAGPELGLLAQRDFGACFVGDRRRLLLSIACYDVHEVVSLPDQLDFEVYGIRRDGSRIALAELSAAPASLYDFRQFAPHQLGITLRKNAVLRTAATIQVSHETLGELVAVEAHPRVANSLTTTPADAAY